jgi:hypothetical protein
MPSLDGLFDGLLVCTTLKQVCSQQRHQSHTGTWYFSNRAQFLPAEYRAQRTSKPRRTRQCGGVLYLSAAWNGCHTVPDTSPGLPRSWSPLPFQGKRTLASTAKASPLTSPAFMQARTTASRRHPITVCLRDRARRSRHDRGLPENDRPDWGSREAPIPDPPTHAAALHRL